MVPELLPMDAVGRRTSVIAFLALGASVASAQEAPPAPTPAPTPVELTDEELERMVTQIEIIQIWDERPDKPYDRDTEVRLTGEELMEQGATDLATALALIPEINVRDGGRGGFNVDIRGARKGALRVLIDGVSVSDPWYGTFDVSTIPVTDIVQIRLSTGPASPIDGPGGPGGVVEVHTRDAHGGRLVVGRLTSDSLPTFGGSATGRTALTPDLSLRLSASGLWGVREFELPSMSQLDEDRRATTGTARLEYRPNERRRIALDGFVDDRTYVPPPTDELERVNVLLIDRETTGRGQLSLDEKVGSLQLAARAWTHALKRRSRNLRQPELTVVANNEELFAMRTGANVLATRPIVKVLRWVASATVDYERARVATAVTNMDDTVTHDVNRGDVILLEAAAGLQYEDGPLRVDGAIGVAMPIGIGADPWPEAKVVTRYRPMSQLELIATLAHKGRTPSLRERYGPGNGNEALDPEIASHGELRIVGRPNEQIEVSAAPYYRRSEGTIRNDTMTGLLTNLGTVDVRGVDARATVRPISILLVGAAYELTMDRERPEPGEPWDDDPLDRLPEHRADAWITAEPWSRVKGTVRARYFGESVDREMPVAAYTTLEASAAATWRDDWMAIVRCDDITDEAPETRSGFHLPGRVFSLIVQGTWD
jgi:outer membrane receptor protein involved in Fe transport